MRKDCHEALCGVVTAIQMSCHARAARSSPAMKCVVQLTSTGIKHAMEISDTIGIVQIPWIEHTHRAMRLLRHVRCTVQPTCVRSNTAIVIGQTSTPVNITLDHNPIPSACARSRGCHTAMYACVVVALHHSVSSVLMLCGPLSTPCGSVPTWASQYTATCYGIAATHPMCLLVGAHRALRPKLGHQPACTDKPCLLRHVCKSPPS